MTDWQTRFTEFHKNNPHILQEILRLSLELKQSGRTKFSMRDLFGLLRYNDAIQTEIPKGDYKLDNSYSAYYARMVMTEYSYFRDFFELRGD